MKVPNIKGLVTVGRTFVQANRPEILFGASVTATLASVVLAFKGGYDARGIIDEEKVRREEDDSYTTSDLTTKEKVQLTWLCTMPAAVTTIGALGSTTGLHISHIKDKKQMAAAALSAIEEVKKSAKEYVEDLQDAVEESTTPKQAEKIESAFQEKRSMRDPLYYVRDARTGRRFLSTESRIQAAVNEVNQMLSNNKDVELNTFYVWADVPEIEEGQLVGWNAGEFVTLYWDDVHDVDGTPIREFTFSPRAHEGFDSSMPRGKGSR